MKMLVALVDS